MSATGTVQPTPAADISVERIAQAKTGSTDSLKAHPDDPANPGKFQKFINNLKEQNTTNTKPVGNTENTNETTPNKNRKASILPKNAPATEQTNTAADAEKTTQTEQHRQVQDNTVAGTEQPLGWPNLPVTESHPSPESLIKTTQTADVIPATTTTEALSVTQLGPNADANTARSASADTQTLTDLKTESNALTNNNANPRTPLTAADHAAQAAMHANAAKNTTASSVDTNKTTDAKTIRNRPTATPATENLALNTQEKAVQIPSTPNPNPIDTHAVRATTTIPIHQPTSAPVINSEASAPLTSTTPLNTLDTLDAFPPPRNPSIPLNLDISSNTTTTTAATTPSANTSHITSASGTSSSPLLTTDANASEAWSRHIEGSVKQMIQHGPRAMTLQMNPSELGRLQIQINMRDEVTSIQFNSQHGFVKEIIESSLPQLRQNLANDGLQLGDIDVTNEEDTNPSKASTDQEQQADASQTEQPPNQQNQKEPHSTEINPEELQNALQQVHSDQRQSVDYFA